MMPQFRLKTLFAIITAAALLAFLVVVLLPYRYMTIGIGHVDLAVTIESDVPVTRVLFECFPDRRTAAWVVSEHYAGHDISFRALPVNNGRFDTAVTFTDKRDANGRELSYTEYRYVVLRCQHPDGTETWKMAEIPRGRGARSMTISIP